ncbi:MAG TPA: hypothetical protein VIJ21_02785 [Solirubrobacterales bacterium]
MDEPADNFVYGQMIQHTIPLEEASPSIALGAAPRPSWGRRFWSHETRTTSASPGANI